jgi:hypothetical protein
MTAPTTTPKRVRWKVATDPLDLARARYVLARDHAERLAGPKAPPCRCPRPWPDHDGGGCLKCGRTMT